MIRGILYGKENKRLIWKEHDMIMKIIMMIITFDLLKYLKKFDPHSSDLIKLFFSLTNRFAFMRRMDGWNARTHP